MSQAGCALETDPALADTVILNTCGFILPALEETEDEIRRLLKLSSRPRVYVFGCAVNRAAAALKKKFPRVDGWFKIGERDKLLRAVALNGRRVEARLVTTAGYAYLKIAEGCSNHCAYCTIPAIRGELKSRSMNELRTETAELLKLGKREIILIAQDTTAYGIDLYGRPMLAELVRELSALRGVSWLRILYAHPASLTENMIDEIAGNPKVCKYIDLPIQHISDRILKLMNRRVGSERINAVIREIKLRAITLRTTVIAGFPTETEAEHRELVEFVQNRDIDWLGVFPYCREPGTKAALLKPVLPPVVRKRYETLLKVQQSILREKNRTRIGRSFKVLINGRNGGYIGHSEFAAPEVDSRIIIPHDNLAIGKFYRARISGRKGRDLIAEVAKRPRNLKNV